MTPRSDALRQRFDFAPPAEYTALEARGAFDPPSGVPLREWSVRPGVAAIWVPDMVWLSASEIVEFAFAEDEWDDFVPFARSAAGDLWCWRANDRHAAAQPVMLCPHDNETGLVHAPDFGSALYRRVVDWMTDESFSTGEPRPASEDEETIRAVAARLAVDLADLWPPLWTECLQRLATRPRREFTWRGRPATGLVTHEERARLFRELFRFAELDDTFRWKTGCF